MRQLKLVAQMLLLLGGFDTLAQRGFRTQFSKKPMSSTLEMAHIHLWNNQNQGLTFMGGGVKWQLARLEAMPRTGETVQEMATFTSMRGDVEKAVALYEESTRLDPKQHYHVGWTYLYGLRDYPRAIRHFDAYDALTSNFDDSNGIYPVSYFKGLAYRNMGNHAEAVRQFNKGIDSLAKKHGSEWVNYKQYVSRAISYLALNQPDKALADLDSTARNLTADSPLVLYYKGKSYTQQGRPTDAKRAYQDAFFFWQANRVKGITQPEDTNNPITERDIEVELK